MTWSVPATVGRRAARGRAGVLAAFSVMLIGSLTPALMGSLAVPMTTELGLDDSGLALAVAALWTAAAFTSPIAGRLSDRVGWSPIALIGLATSASALALVAAVQPGRGWLIAVMFIAGCGLALCSQSSNNALVTEVSGSRLGQAFGIKQSATAAAWLVAGLAAPLVAVHAGWRTAWILAAAFAAPVAGLVLMLAKRHRSSAGSHPPRALRQDHPQVPRKRPRWPLILGFGLGAATISALSTFGAKTLVSTGLSTATAGYVVGIAGALALVGRVLAGTWLDKGNPTLRPASVLLFATMAGLALLAVPASTIGIFGFVAGLAFGSAWPPVVLAVMVRTWPRNPGSATGLAGVGAALGSIIGPLLFGAMAAMGGYVGGWLTLCALAAAAAVLLSRPLQRKVSHSPDKRKGEMMRAYLFDGTEAGLTDVPDPVAGAGEVVLEVTAAGLCHSDLDILARPLSQIRFPLPIVLGHEACGTVVEVGAGVGAVRLGDQVAVHGPRGCGRCRMCASGQENYCRFSRSLGIWPIGLGSDGALAEYLCIKDPASLVPLQGLAPVDAAPLTDAGLTSFHAVRSCTIDLAAESVAVVLGVGGLGHLAVQILRAVSGCRVIAVDVDQRRRDLARALGAHAAVTPQDTPRTVADLTAEQGADLVLDFVGSPPAIDLGLSVLAQHGELVLIGLGEGAASVSMRTVPLGTTVRTIFWGSRAELVDVIALAAEGSIKVHTVQIPLSEVERGYALLRDGQVEGRVVVVPD